MLFITLLLLLYTDVSALFLSKSFLSLLRSFDIQFVILLTPNKSINFRVRFFTVWNLNHKHTLRHLRMYQFISPCDFRVFFNRPWANPSFNLRATSKRASLNLEITLRQCTNHHRAVSKSPSRLALSNDSPLPPSPPFIYTFHATISFVIAIITRSSLLLRTRCVAIERRKWYIRLLTRGRFDSSNRRHKSQPLLVLMAKQKQKPAACRVTTVLADARWGDNLSFARKRGKRRRVERARFDGVFACELCWTSTGEHLPGVRIIMPGRIAGRFVITEEMEGSKL